MAQAGPGPIYDLPCSLGPQISSKNTSFPGFKVGRPAPSHSLGTVRPIATDCGHSTTSPACSGQPACPPAV